MTITKEFACFSLMISHINQRSTHRRSYLGTWVYRCTPIISTKNITIRTYIYEPDKSCTVVAEIIKKRGLSLQSGVTE
jgi:hypothetical protein